MMCIVSMYCIFLNLVHVVYHKYIILFQYFLYEHVSRNTICAHFLPLIFYNVNVFYPVVRPKGYVYEPTGGFMMRA